MLSALESRSALALLTGSAVDTSGRLLAGLAGQPEQIRGGMLELVPELIGYYAEGSAALAADFYDDRREQAGVVKPYTSELVLVDRSEKIRRAVAWSAQPLFAEAVAGVVAVGLVQSRVAEVVQIEVARAFRNTITGNRQNDPESAGWRRITTGGGCKLCRMLADRGAVYRISTARFAAHANCRCTAEPVFNGQAVGEEASVTQYMASRKRTPRQQEALRDFLNANY